LDDDTAKGFLAACMAQLDIELEQVGRMGQYIFGNCEKDEGFAYEGNVIPFPSKSVN
jgi:hypothetical protein